MKKPAAFTLLVLALFRIGAWKRDQERVLTLCSSLLSDSRPLTFQGELSQEGPSRAWLHVSKFPEPLMLAAEIPQNVFEWDREVVVRGKFHCQWVTRNPGILDDGRVAGQFPTLRARPPGLTLVIGKKEGSLFFYSRQRMKEWLLEPFQETREAKAWIQAVWTGDLSSLDSDFRAFYYESGLAQLLALSGQHVICLVLCLQFALNIFLKLTGLSFPLVGRRILPVVAGLLLWMLSGKNPPILRTMAALLAFFALRRRGLRAHPAQVALTTGAILLIWDPGLWIAPSFFLSVLATYLLAEVLFESRPLGRYVWVSFWVPVLGFPATAFLFGRVTWLAPVYTWCLGWLWELLVIPLGFAAPFIVHVLPDVLGKRAVEGLEVVARAFVNWHQRNAAMAGQSTAMVRPVLWEWGIWEVALMCLMQRVKKVLFDNASSIANQGGSLRK